MSPPSPVELLAQVKAFNAGEYDFSSMDSSLRQELHDASQRLVYCCEEPAYAVQRMIMGQCAQTAVMNIALNIGLFPMLAKDSIPKTTADLAAGTGADSALIQRLIRFLAAFGVVAEHRNGSYALTAQFALFGNASFSIAANESLGLIKPMFDHLPGLIQDNGCREPNDRLNGAAQRAMNAPGRELFDLLQEQGPAVVRAFGTFLGAMSKASSKIHEVYPVEERLAAGFDSSISEYLWVDVGGGFGGFTADLKEKFPDLPGKCVVEDLSAMVQAAAAQGIDKQLEFLAHDFFTEQPIKGARAYYIRECFHNWQDQNCITILHKLSEAMKPGYSRILIHEVVMPDISASEWQVTMDVLMMAGYSTLERDEKQWKALVKSAGLKINKIYSRANSAESIIEITRE